MENGRESLVSSCSNSFRNFAFENKARETENEAEEIVSLKGRRSGRLGLSNSFSSQDLRFLDLEEKEESPCSPRGVLEDCSRSLESESASSKASTSDSEGQSDSRTAQHRNGFFRLLKKGPNIKFPTFPQLKNFPPLKTFPPFKTFPPLKGVPKLTRRKSKRIKDDLIPSIKSPVKKTSLDTEFRCFKSSWKNFSLSELQIATNNFSHDNLIGEGGYAQVYKGELEDGELVAIKRLTRGSQEEMTADFLSELGIIVHVDHPNIAKVIGYGIEGGMHLVLHLSPHGSLASILYEGRKSLDWGVRYKVALGIAEGLVYLHEGCQRRIIHRDIKASNILLSEDFEPQIADFGLAKWLPDQWTHHIVSKFEGTFGYLPPEFFMHGMVDEKTDVYAYGVLLLELITGRQSLDSSQQSLVMWAKPLLADMNIKELTDPCLAHAFNIEQMTCMIETASKCIHQSSADRPQMSQVVRILKGEEGGLDVEVGTSRQKCKLKRTYSEELFDADVNDLSRHLEVVLGKHNERGNQSLEDRKRNYSRQ